MKTLVGSLLILLGICLSAGQSSNPGRYRELVQRLKAGDHTVDFTEFRMAFADSPEFRAPDTKLASHAKAAFEAGQYQEVLADAGKMLDEDFADVQAHILSYRAYKELGHADEAALSEFIYEGLLRSIEKSGDGKTKQTAYVVISMSETLLPLWRGQVSEGAFAAEMLPDKEHRWLKVGGVDIHTRKPFVLFFNVDIPVKRIEQQLQKKKTTKQT